jgi:hypothetical protein
LAESDSEKQTELLKLVEMYEQMWTETRQREESDEFKQDNLEYDLRSTGWILDKVRDSRVYSQNLYAALCNNEFYKLKDDEQERVIQILGDRYEPWSCSWRYAGGIIADMRQEGDYIDWYCSGIRHGDSVDDEQFQDMTREQQEEYIESKLEVAESVITDEIREDLLKLGWLVKMTDV